MKIPHRPNGLLVNAMWNGGSIAFTMVLSFVLTPILLRHLGTATYGTLILIWSISGILGTMNMGLGEATLRYVARYAAQDDVAGVNRVFGAVLSLYSVVCLTLVVSMFIGAPVVASWLNTPADSVDLVSWLLRIASLSVAATIIMSAFGAVPLALQRFDIANKISVGSNLARTIGYILFAMSGFSVAALVFWDLIIAIFVLGLMANAAKRFYPKLRMLPRFSFLGIKEIFGYSIFSFLTFFVHKFHRESGKLMLARFLGPGPVVYLATPDNIAQRFHEVIAGGIEASLPRFSAEDRVAEIERLFWSTTWTGLSLSLIVFVPFVILVPDFLRLWISPDFSKLGGLVGQLLGIYLISQGGFTGPAAYFRGTGKPEIVTLIILGSLVITVISGIILIPTYGPVGAAYAYLAGSAAPFLGMTAGSLYAFGWSAASRLVRNVVIPLVAAAAAGGIGLYVSTYIGTESWPQFLASGLMIATVTASLVFGADCSINGAESTSLALLRKIGRRLPFNVPQRT